MSDEHLRVARNWIARAFRDLENARILADADPLSPNSMWLMQQSVEKGIKALLITYGVEFRKIHDLEGLQQSLPENSAFRKQEFDLQKLTDLGIESRYPEEADELLMSEIREAIETAGQILALLAEELGYETS
ncbi:MAG: HEPN domain-containing protein [bacterium]